MYRSACEIESGRLALAVALALTVCLVSVSSAQGLQSERIRNPEPKTQVSFELLMAARVPPLAAQRWGDIFRRAGATIRIRQAIGNDRVDVTEMKRGSLRFVKAIGVLEADGSIRFKDRSFRQSQSAALGEWIRELKTYGAQGSDEGKPGFGLTKTQFNQVFTALEQKVALDPAGLSLDKSLRALGLPASLPLRLTAEAEEVLRSRQTVRPASDGLATLSRGTALAIILNDVGLGFRPGRTPSGFLELRISPLEGSAASWPIGWPLAKPPISSMPKLVEMIPVDLEDVPLTDVLIAVSAQTEIPIITDERRVSEAGVRLEELKVNQPFRRMTWSGVLDRATFPKLMRELLQDEAGTPFVWVTTRTTKQMNERAKQRDRQFELNGR